MEIRTYSADESTDHVYKNAGFKEGEDDESMYVTPYDSVDSHSPSNFNDGYEKPNSKQQNPQLEMPQLQKPQLQLPQRQKKSLQISSKARCFAGVTAGILIIMIIIALSFGLVCFLDSKNLQDDIKELKSELALLRTNIKGRNA